MKIGYILVIVLLLYIQGEAQTWNLVWSDEFDSSGINLTNWKYDTGGSGFGNNELEYYTTRPENAKTENGNLLIIAIKETYSGKSYTSARLKTQDLQNFQYGKIEARIKIPLGQGLWPAFWMLGQNIGQVGWPQCGEVDIMEHVNTDNVNVGTMHWDNNGHVQYGKTVACNQSTYHDYSIVWDAFRIQWFLDGIKYAEGSITNNVNSTDEFHLPFFIILNLAVGGNWPGSPNSTTPFPDTMYVDYVRVYQAALTGVNENPGQVSNNFSLMQNYPNPFNPSTNISYSIPASSFTTLKVFDVMGREVSTLVSEVLTGGTHSQQWDAADFPSGVYFYRLQASAYSETKKLLLLR